MSATDPLPVPGPGTASLRAALLTASFTVDGLLDLLGAPAYAALARGETVPARRATRADAPLSTLVRLFLLRCAVPADRAAAVLPVDAALAEGWLQRGGEEADRGANELRASVDVRPYAGPEGQDWWIVSDPGHGLGKAAGAPEDGPDVVLGVGGASSTLAQLTARSPVGRALDLGTGSGVQALHLSQHADQVTATDLNPRALQMARLTLALSGVPEADLKEGSLFDPVAGEAPYDLIVSNPPFVISPLPTERQRLTYRDAGMAGDDLCRALVHAAAGHLADGGRCQLLANWEQGDDEDWRERLRAWVPDGCDAWIVRREEQDVTQYTEWWLRDAGAHLGEPTAYAQRYADWLDDFAARGTTSIGFGWIALRRTNAGQPSVTVEDWPHAVEQPLGGEVQAHFERQDFLRAHPDAALLARRYVLAEGVVQEQIGTPGAEDPEYVVLRQRHGMMRATILDTVGAGFAGSCDGTLAAGDIADAIAQLLDEDAGQLRERLPQSLRALIGQGFLLHQD